MTQARYLCPACGKTLSAAVALRVRQPFEPGAGPGPVAPGDRAGRRIAVALPRRAGVAGAAARVAGRRLDPAGNARLGRRGDPLQARKPDADRLVQGPWYRGDA